MESIERLRVPQPQLVIFLLRNKQRRNTAASVSATRVPIPFTFPCETSRHARRDCSSPAHPCETSRHSPVPPASGLHPHPVICHLAAPPSARSWKLHPLANQGCWYPGRSCGSVAPSRTWGGESWEIQLERGIRLQIPAAQHFDQLERGNLEVELEAAGLALCVRPSATPRASSYTDGLQFVTHISRTQVKLFPAFCIRVQN